MNHAYVSAGDKEAGLARARALADSFDISKEDITVLQFELLSVEDARRITEYAHRAPLKGGAKALIITVERFFHEAQNALLKTFEEPPLGTHLFLVVPKEGMLLPTLRSRLSSLSPTEVTTPEIAHTFLSASSEAQVKHIEAIVTRAKSDREEEKQKARTDARLLAESLSRIAHASFRKEGSEEVAEYLRDLSVFIPILYERSPALKPILEHLRIALPKVLVHRHT